MPIIKIISGGQTGADRGALDAAIELGIAHGGFCPRRRRSEDGRIPDHYQLVETVDSSYSLRTFKNVVSADFTLIIAPFPLAGGSMKTWRACANNHKPCYWHLFNENRIEGERQFYLQTVREILADCAPRILNVAGARESRCPGIQKYTKNLLIEILKGSSKS